MSKPQKHRKEVLGTKEALLPWEMSHLYTMGSKLFTGLITYIFIYTHEYFFSRVI